VKLYEAVARSLAEAGVDRLFGLMGDANMRYIAAYQDLGRGRYVGSTIEAGAVMMADGYARMTGRLGVVTITHGPGLTNGLTALTEAVRARTPLLLITGATPSVRDHLQWLDLRAAAALTGAGYAEVHGPASALDDLAIAMRLAYAKRRPYLVDVPADLLAADVDDVVSPFASMSFAGQAMRADADKLDAAVGVIVSASRPVVLAGRGALLAREDVLRLAELVSAPVATTVLAKDMFAGHPLDLGLFGTESHSLAVKFISQADCVIAIGAGLNRYTAAGGDLLAGKAVVHVDTDLDVLATRHPATVSVQADAATFARDACRAVGEAGAPDNAGWANRVRAELATFSAAADFRDRSGADSVDMRTAMITLDEVLPADRTVVTDVGRFKSAPWRYLHNGPGRFSQTASFGAIGLGLGAAIGAAFARPDELTVCVTGDGGLMMCLLELSTAVQHRLPLLVAVLNDGSYGAEYTKLGDFGHDPDYSLRPWPSFADVAAALGADVATVRTPDDIRQLKSTFERLDRPFLLDILADPAVDTGRFE
jgi:thiamine pyrophosphate-dependent acetolactate synthase large subunit-like protein